MITTVRGDIEAENLGYILPHEHIFSDLRPLVAPIDDEDFYKELALSNLGKVLRNPYAVLDNALLDNDEAALKEMEYFKKAGGSLIADVTTLDFGRNAQRLRALSEKSGVHIVAGCGNYIDASVSAEERALSETEIYNNIMNDLTVGIDGTDIKAGVIGEIGSSGQMTDYEKKSLAAATKAQKDSGCGMHIHACLWNREGLAALKHCIANGADASKLCVDHSDVVLDEGYMMGILEEGAYVEFDNFGKEFYVDRKNRNLLEGSFASDKERVQVIKKLLDKGFEKQILITNDICLKNMTHTYGGWGYDHVITNIIPMMEDFGITEGQINAMMVKNPIEFLERR